MRFRYRFWFSKIRKTGFGWFCVLWFRHSFGFPIGYFGLGLSPWPVWSELSSFYPRGRFLVVGGDAFRTRGRGDGCRCYFTVGVLSYCKWLVPPNCNIIRRMLPTTKLGDGTWNDKGNQFKPTAEIVVVPRLGNSPNKVCVRKSNGWRYTVQ